MVAGAWRPSKLTPTRLCQSVRETKGPARFKVTTCELLGWIYLTEIDIDKYNLLKR
jgi:hypothetical protein